MKNTFIRLLSLFIALCFVLPLIVACAGNTTETTTEKATESATENTENQSESESATDASEEFETNDRGPDSVCFIGDDAIDPNAHFFDSIEEAVAANPDGAVVKLCTEISYDEVFRFPDTAAYVLDFNGYDVDITFDSGVAVEYWTASGVFYLYSNRLSAILETNERYLVADNQPQLWVFGETDGLEVGRYHMINENEGVEDAEPEYRYDYFEDLSEWGRKYVAICGWDNRAYYFYTLQEAFDQSESEYGVVKIFVLRDCAATNEDGVFECPWNGYSYRISYAYHYVDGAFSKGVTYDDMADGYCYYSTLDLLSVQSSLVDTCCWMWSDEDGYLPGKYMITANVDHLGSEADEWDPKTRLYTVLHVGQYIYTHVEDSSLDEFRAKLKKSCEKDS